MLGGAARVLWFPASLALNSRCVAVRLEARQNVFSYLCFSWSQVLECSQIVTLTSSGSQLTMPDPGEAARKNSRQAGKPSSAGRNEQRRKRRLRSSVLQQRKRQRLKTKGGVCVRQLQERPGTGAWRCPTEVSRIHIPEPWGWIQHPLAFCNRRLTWVRP